MNEYALHDDGRWYVHLPMAPHSYGKPDLVSADGTQGHPALVDKWWEFDHEPKEIRILEPARKRLVGHALQPGFEPSERLPAFIEPSSESECLRIEGAYESVYEDIPGEIVTVTGPWLRLDGTPPRYNANHPWTARLPFELRERREYLHLFPGEIGGLTYAVAQALKAEYGDGAVTWHPHRETEVGLRKHVAFAPPKTRVEKGPRGGKGRAVPASVYVSHDWKLPRSVAGANYADAWAKLQARVAEVLEEAREVTAARCGHCDGRGYVTSEDKR